MNIQKAKIRGHVEYCLRVHILEEKNTYTTVNMIITIYCLLLGYIHNYIETHGCYDIPLI